MKKLLSISLLVLLAGSGVFFALNSCTKENKDSDSKEIFRIEKSEPAPKIIEVSCAGTCTGTTNACGQTWNQQSGDVTCNCEGCTMTFTIDNPADRSTTSRANLPELASAFNDYVVTTHSTNDYMITSFKHILYDKVEIIEIVYEINSESFSVMIVVTYDTIDALTAKNKVLVDCHGSCAANPGNCIEKANVLTGEVYCGCEDDNCKMTIQEL